MDYSRHAGQTAHNGEPGYLWVSNMQKFGRMIDRVAGAYERFANWLWKDRRAKGSNPCVEQTLESYECCNLVEVFPDAHDSIEDFKRTLKFAYLYGKTVTLVPTHWPRTNQIMLRNRRIGCSMAGIQQFIAQRGIEEFRSWCDVGYDTIHYYDKVYSEWFCVPRSVKTTSIKPGGTTPLLRGATPGGHWPEDLFCIRRIRVSTLSELLPPLREAGYVIEPCVGQEETTVVVEIPLAVDSCGGKLRTTAQVSMWEQLEMAAFLQEWWADNQVSCTVTFNPETEGEQIQHALNYFQYRLKGISFLPKLAQGAFAQMPYESITEAEYRAITAGLKPVSLFGVGNEEADPTKFCDSDSCTL